MHSSPSPVTAPAKARTRLPPGPRGLPFLGSLLDVKLSVFNDLGRLAQEYGPIFSLRLGSRLIVVLASADALHEVCATKGASCAARPKFLNTDVISGGGRSILYANGEAWHSSRRLVARSVLSAPLLPHFAGLINEELALVMAGLDAATHTAGVRKAVTLHLYKDLLKKARFDLMARLLTGTSVAHDETTFAPLRAAAEAEAGNFGPQLADFLPILRPWAYLRRLRPLAAHIDRFRAYFLAEIRRREAAGCPSRLGALDLMLEERERTRAASSSAAIDKHTSDESLTYMLYNLMGTTNPTHIAVMRSLWMLLRHPEALRRAQEEVDRVVGRDGALSFEDQEQLTYLRAAIEETLRIQPPTPSLVPHLCTEDIVTRQGYLIPAGAIILANIAAAGRDPAAWTDPQVFRPERFLVKGDAAAAGARAKLNYHSMPFGLGVRACPAQKLSLMIVTLWLAHLLKRFDLTLDEPAGLATASGAQRQDVHIFNNLPPDFCVRFSPRETL